MSNSRAIAAVTATLRNLLEQGVNAAAPSDVNADPALAGTTVTVRPPDQAQANPAGNQLNLFLYHISQNSAWRSQPVPHGVTVDGHRHPPLALDLFYLVTALEGTDGVTDLFGHRLLGRAMSILHDHPVLSRDEIQLALPESSLHEQLERIRITPHTMSVEEMTRLWSIFEARYRVSVAYQVSVVLIDSARSQAIPLPVRDRKVGALPMRRPIVERLLPSIATPGSVIKIVGHNLAADSARVVIDSRPPINPTTVSQSHLTISLPLDLRAGAHTLQVAHELDFGEGADQPRRAAESNVVAFVLTPQITSTIPNTVPRNSTLSLSFTPPVDASQQVLLLVGNQPIAVRPPATGSTNTLDFPIPNHAATGKSLLRLRINGADSPLQVDGDAESPTFNQYTGPQIDIT